MFAGIMTLVVFASQVHFEDNLSLGDIAQKAEWIVVVERAKPTARWTAVETLVWRGKGAAPTGEITVKPAHQDFNDQVAEHIAKHGYQGVPSPIFQRYVSSLSPEAFNKAKRAILFLRRYKDGWMFVDEGAWESEAKRAAIKP
jgi:hypothetical protein